MSQSLFQLQNNQIIVCKDNKTYRDTLDNFKLDYPAHDLGDVTEIIYNQTLGVYVIDNEMMDVKVDAALDKVIDSIDNLIGKQAARQPAAPAPERPAEQEYENIDLITLALAEAVAEQEARIQKLEGSEKA